MKERVRRPSLLEDHGFPIYLVDRNGAILEMNRSASNLAGDTRGPLWKLSPWRESPDAAQVIRRFFAAVAGANQSQSAIFGLAAGSGPARRRWEFTIAASGSSAPEGLVLKVEARDNRHRPEVARLSAEELLRFRFSFETARVGPWTWDVINDQISAHPIVTELFELPGDFEFANATAFFALVHPEDRARVVADVSGAVAGGSRLEHEYRIALPGGTVRWLASIGGIERDAAGQATHFYGVVSDITEKIRALEALRRSEEKFRLIFESSPAGMVTVEADGRIRDANDAFCRFLDISREGISDRGLLTLTHPDDRLAIAQQIQPAGKERGDTEVRYIKSGGESVWGHTASVCVEDAGGTPLWIVVVLDVTAHKLAEAILKENEEKFRIFANDTPAYLWATNGEGHDSFVNRRCREFLGIGAESAGHEWMESVHPEDCAMYRQRFAAALRSRVPFEVTFRLRRSDEEYRWVLDQGTPRFSPSGEFLGYSGAFLDITERVRDEQHIYALTEKLIHAQEGERSRIARELHDDLSQQIAALSLGVANLRRRVAKGEPDALESIDRIHNGLVSLAKGVRTLSHQLHPAMLEQTGISAALESYCSEFTALTGIRVELRPDKPVRGLDPVQSLTLYRIAQEALQNVARHAGVDVVQVELIRYGPEVRLTISDSGAGFDTGAAASGLGLISMRERLRVAHGQLHITSATGTGTTLVATIPIS